MKTNKFLFVLTLFLSALTFTVAQGGPPPDPDAPGEDSVYVVSTSFASFQQAEENTFTAVVSVTSAQLLASNATPVTLITVPNANYLIVPVSVVAHFDYTGTAYTTNTTANVGLGDGTVLLTGNISLAVTADQVTVINPAYGGTQATTKGKNLILKTATGNPAAGTGTMKLYITYRLINLTSGGF